LNLVAVISSPEIWDDIDEVLKKLNKEVYYKKIDVETDIMSEIERVSSMSVNYIVIDMSCLDDCRRLPQAIRKMMLINENVRFFIIASEKFAGSEVISTLISMGIYDIIGQNENEEKNVSKILLKRFEEPATYAMAVKWDAGFSRKRDKEKEFVEKGTGRFGQKDTSQVKTIEKDKIVGTVVIAVVGAMNRIGTTHTAISLAKYLIDNRYGVAVVELHNSNVFERIRDSYENVVEKSGMFSLAGIDFYPFDPTRSVSDLTLDDYNYIILDMGVYSKCNIAEFRRAQERIVVCGVKDWELEELEELIECEEKNFKNRYYFTFSDDPMFEFVKSSMDSLSCFKAPYNPQPFHYNEDCAKVFKELLKNVLPQVNDDADNESFLKYLLKKKGVKLYHKPILLDKIKLRNLEKEKDPRVTFKKYMGFIKTIIFISVVLIVVISLYRLFVKTDVFLEIKNFINQLFF